MIFFNFCKPLRKEKHHKHWDGTFVDAQAERIHNDVEIRIQKVQIQLSWQISDGVPV